MEKERKGLYNKVVEKPIDTEKPSMFLRVGAKGGLYFLSPKKTMIYYMSGRHVKELMDGKRDFACIHQAKVKLNDNK